MRRNWELRWREWLSYFFDVVKRWLFAFGVQPGNGSSECNQYRKGDQKFKRGGQPHQVASTSAITAKGQRQQSCCEGNQCGLPNVIRNRGDHSVRQCREKIMSHDLCPFSPTFGASSRLLSRRQG